MNFNFVKSITITGMKPLVLGHSSVLNSSVSGRISQAAYYILTIHLYFRENEIFLEELIENLI